MIQSQDWLSSHVHCSLQHFCNRSLCHSLFSASKEVIIPSTSPFDDNHVVCCSLSSFCNSLSGAVVFRHQLSPTISKIHGFIDESHINSALSECTHSRHIVCLQALEKACSGAVCNMLVSSSPAHMVLGANIHHLLLRFWIHEDRVICGDSSDDCSNSACCLAESSFNLQNESLAFFFMFWPTCSSHCDSSSGTGDLVQRRSHSQWMTYCFVSEDLKQSNNKLSLF